MKKIITLLSLVLFFAFMPDPPAVPAMDDHPTISQIDFEKPTEIRIPAVPSMAYHASAKTTGAKCYQTTALSHYLKTERGWNKRLS